VKKGRITIRFFRR